MEATTNTSDEKFKWELDFLLSFFKNNLMFLIQRLKMDQVELTGEIKKQFKEVGDEFKKTAMAGPSSQVPGEKILDRMDGINTAHEKNVHRIKSIEQLYVSKTESLTNSTHSMFVFYHEEAAQSLLDLFVDNSRWNATKIQNMKNELLAVLKENELKLNQRSQRMKLELMKTTQLCEVDLLKSRHLAEQKEFFLIQK